MKYIFLASAFTGLAGFFLFAAPRVTVITPSSAHVSGKTANAFNVPAVPEAQQPSSTASEPIQPQGGSDIAKQSKLANPPAVMKGLYLTGWSAGSPSKVASTIAFMEKSGLNAVVIDIKDYSGYVSYAMDVPEAKASGAENELRILHPNEMLKEFHDHNIYVIARVTVFQDPILAKAHPEWALKNVKTGKTWTDNHGLAWMDPAGQGTWDYVAAIARDAFGRGFDEVNFDYVRFASDGTLGAIQYPFWDQKTPRSAVIKKFFSYLRSQLSSNVISADIFGLAAVDTWDDLGIGQVLENALPYFDYVCPMVYPSHYAVGTLNYKNPADHPYEIIKYSLEGALKRRIVYGKEQIVRSNSTSSTSTSLAISHKPLAKLRPWLQAFDLGAVYTPAMVNTQIKAVDDALVNSSATRNLAPGDPANPFGGWLLWDPANRYTSYRPAQ